MVSPSSASRSSDAAPVSTAARSAQPMADVFALTSQDDFLLELGEALSGQAAVHPVDSLDAALAGIGNSRRTPVLVIDARALEDVSGAVDQVHAVHPALALLVFADGEVRRQLTDVNREKHFAVLATPIEVAKARSVLERAINAAVAFKSGAAAPAAAVEATPVPGEVPAEAVAPVRAAADAGIGGAGKSPLVLVGGATALLAVLAAAGFWLFHAQNTPVVHEGAAPVAQPAPAVAENTILRGKVDELLEKARLAMHERRFSEPTGDNALLYYRSAAAADPANAEARDGLQRIGAALASRFDEALNAGRYEEAALSLASFRLASPADERSGTFEQHLYAAEIARAIADGNIDRANTYLRQAQQSGALPADLVAKWRTEITHRQEAARLEQLASKVEERIRDGHLVDGEDSAKAYLSQLESSAADSPVTDRATHELISALLRRAREAGLAKNAADEEHWLSEARALGLKPAEVLAFQKELGSARQKAVAGESEHALQLAHDRLQDGRLTDPAQDSAVFYLSQVQANDPSNPGLADAGRSLAKALLGRARVQAQAGKSADADLAQARVWGADPAEIQAVQQLQQAPRQAAAVDPALLAANLKRTRSAPPDYPPNALAQKLAGSVTLQFTVDTRGEPRDVHVVEATAPGVFDQAALSAVRHWRYQPMVVNGAAVEVPVTARMRFELPK